jgi:two-component system, OmpR family, phosphate regulon sensor histidine kinase PhoR
MRRLGTAALLAGVPAGVLAFMAAVGWAAFWPAVAGIAICAAASCSFTMIWARDLDLLSDAVRRVAAEEPGHLPRMTERPVMMEALGDEIDRMARRMATRSALQEQHRRADTLILERLPDPILVLSSDRSIRRTNAAARAAFSDDIAAVLRHPAVRGAIDRGMTTKLGQTAEISLRAPIHRDIYTTIVPMDPPLADGGQVLVVLSDRTRERVAEHMRADFVANVSHELRTPLASLIGFVETLRGPAKDDPPAQQRFLEIMAEQGARMNRLIDDLLSLSRIELSEHQIPSEPLDVAQLLKRIAAGFEPRLKTRNVELALRIDENLPIVAGDADQMAQVLQNLLDNGLKYGRDGGVLTLTAARAEPRTPWPGRPGLVISVIDQGAGIPREHLPRLTERFYRVDKGRSRAVGGTGLGLAIVKHIVNRHRGGLVVESAEGQGTTFSVYLPAA